jgi:NOL1/NOP2/sun family putative RNA methylase
MDLPVSFEESMKRCLGDSWEEFLYSYEEGGYAGIRYNPLKITKEAFEQSKIVKFEKVPWCPTGYRFDGSACQPAKHPYYHAGLFYIQEPSAMLPAALLPVEPGDKVLDLCAAPGGKSTQIAGKLQGKGLLVSNDISVSRAKALVKNLEMAGVKNAVVTSESPEKLSKALPGFFDKILIDAPCSGEGMFRKNPQMVRDYMERGPEFYAKLQKEILEDAIKMLKPGGYLVYSTCTFSPLEDEAIVEWMLEFDSDLEVVPGDSFEGRDHGHPEWILSDREEIRYAYRMWPHKIKGEGHFAVLLKKRDGQEGRFSYAKKGAKLSEEAEAFLKEIHFRSEHGRYQEISGKLYWVPEEMPDVKGIRIVRSGLYLGENKKKRFEPSQALAMALDPHTYEKSISLPLQDERVIKYLKCETIDLEGPNGTVLICVDGYPLGWGKLNNGRLKNKYAAAWRWM